MMAVRGETYTSKRYPHEKSFDEDLPVLKLPDVQKCRTKAQELVLWIYCVN